MLCPSPQGQPVPRPYLDQNRFDDYIACPQNGYRALQVTAWLPDLGAIEVAIATRDMEGENHWGVVYALQQGKDISQYRPIESSPPAGVRVSCRRFHGPGCHCFYSARISPG